MPRIGFLAYPLAGCLWTRVTVAGAPNPKLQGGSVLLKIVGIGCGAVFVFAVVLIALIAIIANSSDGESNDRENGGNDVPVLTEMQKSTAIDTIMGYDLVRDAAISQNGRDLSLAIIVNDAASEEYAKQLGDNFVRLVKTFGPEESPDKEIGAGIYNYLIGIYTPTEKTIAQGAKARFATRISW